MENKRKFKFLSWIVLICCWWTGTFILPKEDVIARDANVQLPRELEEAKVVRVVDGDTIVVNRGRGKERVRFVLVNTPETVHPNKAVEYYGKEASAFTKRQLTGRKVFLEKDVSERDRYGRLLRYVWLERPEKAEDLKTKCFSAILLREGYAHLSTFPPDVKYHEQFLAFEREAKENKKGLWAPHKESRRTSRVGQ